jgi:hypothetical protein
MLFIEQLGKTYYCPLKDNRQADDSNDGNPYQRADSIDWTSKEHKHGKDDYLQQLNNPGFKMVLA